jgi:ABC-2 type transport system ATP-binding protein
VPTNTAIVVEGVTRRFAARRRAQVAEAVALDTVSLTVAAGTLFGLLGPNGAGKTTLLRLISTLLVPSAGRIAVLGYDVVRRPDAVRRRIGAVLGGDRSIYWRLTGRENLLYAGALHDLPATVATERAGDLLRLVELSDRADDLVERYSTGMRQRLALARALMHDPPLLILDEPTAGLDPQAAEWIRRLLETLSRDQARTIVLATHNMQEADRLCGVVGILDHGRLIALATPAALKAHSTRDGTGLERPGAEPTLETVFLALTGRSLAAADASGESS